MTFSHSPIDLWEEVATPIMRIITPQRRSTLPFDQPGFNLYTLTEDADLKKAQLSYCINLQGDGGDNAYL